MDRRNLRWLLCGLFAATCGCTHPIAMMRSYKSTADQDAVVHKAPTYEAYANLQAQSAFSPDRSDQEKAQFREEAKLAYLKAIEVDAKFIPAYIGLARLQVRSEDHAGAIGTYNKALKLAPKEAGLWYELGLTQCRQKNWQDGIVHLQKACELSPDNKQYRTTLGYTLGRAGRLQESLNVLVQALGEPKAHYDMARMLQHMNQPELAKQQAALAAQKDPNLAGAKELVASLEGKPQPEIQTTSYVAAPDSEVTTAKAETPANVAPPEAVPPPPPGGSGLQEGKPVRMPPLPVIRVR